MQFDRPLTAVLIDEPELVVAGMTAMLSPYAERVTVMPDSALGAGEADLRLHDPYTRHCAESSPESTDAGGVVFTWEMRDGFVERAMSAGAAGYLSKALPAIELVVALEKVFAGERFVALDYRHHASSPGATGPSVGLTPRETDVVGCIASGMSNREIAALLHLSMNTVKSHIRTAYRSMGVTSRTQAVLWAVEHGVTAPGFDVGARAS